MNEVVAVVVELVAVIAVVAVVELDKVGKVVEIDCEKSMKLETSPKVQTAMFVKKNICAGFVTVSVKKLLQLSVQEVYDSIGRFYYIIGHLLHYRAFFITLWGTYYSIGRLLHYRLVQLVLSSMPEGTYERYKNISNAILKM